MKKDSILIIAVLIFVAQTTMIVLISHGMKKIDVIEPLSNKQKLIRAIENEKVNLSEKELTVLLKQEFILNNKYDKLLQSLLKSWKSIILILVGMMLLQVLLIYKLVIKYKQPTL